MRPFRFGTIPISTLFLLLSLSCPPARAADKKPMTAEVARKALPIEVEVSGTFQAEDKERIAVEPEEYSGELIIKYIIPEGTPVKKGDRLLEFEEDNLKKAITKAESAVDDAQVALQKAQAELEAARIDRDTAIAKAAKELELAERAAAAEEEQVAFKRKDKETEIRRREESVRDKEVNFLQLKKLYQDRELHTETEEILVEREKRSLEEAKKDLEKLRREFEHFKKYEMTVELEKKKLTLMEKQAEKKKVELRTAAELAEKKGAVRKAERELKEAEKKVADLKQDLESLTVHSPRDGVVFYGTLGGSEGFEDVVIFTSGGIRQNLRVGGRVRTHETLLTVASMEKLSVEMKVLENDIQHMKEGLRVTLRPDAFPDLSIEGKIDKVDRIASRGTAFFSTAKQFKVKASYEGVYPQLRAGMSCRVTVHADSIPDAVQVPVAAVFEEEGRYFCYADDGGKPKKRPVKLGATNGRAVQILEGVRPGERVFLYDPFKE